MAGRVRPKCDVCGTLMISVCARLGNGPEDSRPTSKKSYKRVGWMCKTCEAIKRPRCRRLGTTLCRCCDIMVTQNLVTEEVWYNIYQSSMIQERGYIYDNIKQEFPDMTDEQYEKAVGVVMARILKLAKYE